MGEHGSDGSGNSLQAQLAATGGEEAALLNVVVEKLTELYDAVHAQDERIAALEGSHAAPQVPFEQWVEWIRQSYGLTSEIPDTWPRIPGMAHDLRALHAWWCQSHKADATPKIGSSAAGWHDALARFLHRANEMKARGDQDGRFDPPTPPWTGPAGKGE